ncbi:MAG TPA: VWA domain-containing protein [Candidatus Binataceae bacterium]|nr:VWA domain-containing protein [Candidatus Binataceae bacterium]
MTIGLGGAILIFALMVCARIVGAQQGSFPAPLELPRNQPQSGAGSTLEVPANGLQHGATDQLPPIAPQAPQELSIAPRQLRNQSGYEQVTVTVTKQDGTYQTGLQRDDLQLSIDGQNRPIEFFRRDLNTPVSVGILVDTSGSMRPKIPQARAAITTFIEQLNPQDDIFLVAFSDRDYLLQPFTLNHRLVIDKLQILNPWGETALYDTIIEGLIRVRHGRWDKKALLVVTDGMDNESQADLQDVVAYARRMGVLVYSIGIGEDNGGGGGGLFSAFSGIDEVDGRTLRLLSGETGAKTYVLREVGDGEAMRDACRSISEELREQYTVGFVAPNASSGGYRTIRVDVPKHPEDTVRVRKGVTVAGGTESASAGAIGAP